MGLDRVMGREDAHSGRTRHPTQRGRDPRVSADDSHSPKIPPPGWRRFLPRDPWQVIIGPLLILVVGGGITAATRGGGDKKEPELRALPAVVVNGHDESDSVRVMDEATGRKAPGVRQADAGKPRVEIRLHNVGGRRSVLTSARLIITRSARATICGIGAGLRASASYDVILPARRRARQVVEVPINQQLGPDRADRFSFRLGTREAYDADLGTTVIYEMKIVVLHDNATRPLKVGEIVVAVPSTPDRNPSGIDAPYGYFLDGSDCQAVPPPAVRAASTLRGTRSPELDDFLRFLKAPQ